MKFIRPIIPYLDDILVVCALVCFVVASYMVNAVLGTYILGTAFFVAAVFAGRALESLLPQRTLEPKKHLDSFRMRIRKKK